MTAHQTGRSCSKSPVSCTLVGKPWAVLEEGRREWGSVRGSEQSSKVAGQELTWRNWDWLVVPVSSTTLRSRWAALPPPLLLSSFPPRPPTSHRITRSTALGWPRHQDTCGFRHSLWELAWCQAHAPTRQARTWHLSLVGYRTARVVGSWAGIIKFCTLISGGSTGF